MSIPSAVSKVRSSNPAVVTLIIAGAVIVVVLIGALTLLTINHHNVDLKAAGGWILTAISILFNLGLFGSIKKTALDNGQKTQRLQDTVTNGGLATNVETAVRNVMPNIIKDMGVLTKNETPIPATFDWVDEAVKPKQSFTVGG